MSDAECFDTRLRPADIDPQRPEPIDTPWGSFALFLVGERVRAVQSFCPHLQGPLFQGTLSGATITCPWHQWCFSLEDGARLDQTALLHGGKPRLRVCAVSESAGGTLVLARPAP